MGYTGRSYNLQQKLNKRTAESIASDATSQANGISDVSKRVTDGITAEDKKLLAGDWATRYFQSANSFRINEALREASDRGDTNAAIFSNPTVQAMDRSMRPTNADMRVLRKCDNNFLDRIMGLSGVPEDVASRLSSAAMGLGRFNQADVDVLKSKLVGGTFHENAFMSTTYNNTLSDSAFRGRRITLDISVAKGTPGLFSWTRMESEFVMARTVGQNVADIQITDGGRQLKFITRT